MFRTKHKMQQPTAVGKKLRRRHPAGWIFAALETSSLVKGLIAVSCSASAILIIAMGRMPHRELLDLYVGQPSPKDVFAEVGFSYENKEETDTLRREASQKVIPHYSLSAQRLRECALQIRESAGLSGESEAGLAAGEGKPAESGRPPALSARELEVIRTAPDPPTLARQMGMLLAKLGSSEASLSLDAERMTEAVGKGQEGERHRIALVKVARDRIDRWAAEVFPRDKRMRDAVVGILGICCEKSVEYDERLTQRMKDMAADRIKPVVSRVQPGRKIVDRGYEVTPQQMDAYLAYLARREHVEPIAAKMQEQLYYILGLTLLVVMFCIVTRRYLMYYQAQIYRSNSSLVMIGLIVLASLLLSRGITMIPFGTIKSSWNNIFSYCAVVSVPMAAILLALLLSRTLALYFTVLIGIFVGVMKGFSLPYTIVSTVGGIVAVYSTAGVRRRSQLLKAAATIALANVITIGALDAIGNVNIVSATAGFRVAGGFLQGMLSTFLAASFLPLFEHAFNVVTEIRLLELSDLNHPLLKRMFIEAPGTYHHSLMVGNLAETAAEAVGANPLQVRVCAHFHDIGKLKKPQYFTENEPYGESKHADLNPHMSSLIILSHVKDGIDMAIGNKLNRKIIDAVREHHGTGLVYFFYRRAAEARGEGEEVAQEDFRYPGPKPQSKETAILLLADAVEAASRSLDHPTPSRVGNLVRTIIYQRVVDGQLEECDLTFNDLRLIAERFEHILNSSFHTRVRYPEREGAAGENGGPDEGLSKEPHQEAQD